MPAKTIILLILSSLLNAALAAVVLVFWGFATNPTMPDVTLRIGFYLLPVVAAAAAAGLVLPWVLARRRQGRAAAFAALLPSGLFLLVALAFLLLDSWLQRTFSG